MSIPMIPMMIPHTCIHVIARPNSKAEHTWTAHLHRDCTHSHTGTHICTNITHARKKHLQIAGNARQDWSTQFWFWVSVCLSLLEQKTVNIITHININTHNTATHTHAHTHTDLPPVGPIMGVTSSPTIATKLLSIGSVRVCVCVLLRGSLEGVYSLKSTEGWLVPISIHFPFQEIYPQQNNFPNIFFSVKQTNRGQTFKTSVTKTRTSAWMSNSQADKDAKEFYKTRANEALLYEACRKNKPRRTLLSLLRKGVNPNCFLEKVCKCVCVVYVYLYIYVCVTLKTYISCHSPSHKNADRCESADICYYASLPGYRQDFSQTWCQYRIQRSCT